MSRDYWVKSVESSFSEHGITATKEQIKQIAGDIELSHNQYDMAYGYDVASQNLQASKDDEIAKLRKELQLEREKQICKDCSGYGYITFHRCSKCNGVGWL